MLVLSRKRQQAIVIGSTDGSYQVCRVTVLEIRGGTVRLGIDVDDQVPVLRSEIADRADSSPPDKQTLRHQAGLRRGRSISPLVTE